jgi:hypothetical protein
LFRLGSTITRKSTIPPLELAMTMVVVVVVMITGPTVVISITGVSIASVVVAVTMADTAIASISNMSTVSSSQPWYHTSSIAAPVA